MLRDPGAADVRTSTYTHDVETALHALSARAPLTILTGDEGTGKTTVCRVLASRFSTRTTGRLLVAPLSPSDMAGLASSIVVVDEAHNLTTECLADLIRRAAAGAHPTRIVLAGRSSLFALLDDPAVQVELQAVAVLRQHLSPLAGDQIKSFMERRWWSAQGGIAATARSGAPRLTRAAADRVAEISRGNPRIVGALADAALQLADGRSSMVVDTKRVIDLAAGLGLVQEQPVRKSRRAWSGALAAAAAMAAIILGTIGLTSSRRVETAEPATAQRPSTQLTPAQLPAAQLPSAAPAPGAAPGAAPALVANVTDVVSLRKDTLANAERLSAAPDVLGLLQLQDAAKTWDAQTRYANHPAVEQLLVDLDRITNNARERQLIEDGRALRQAAQRGQSQ